VIGSRSVIASVARNWLAKIWLMAAADNESDHGELLPVAAAFEELLKAKLGELVPEPKKQEVTRVVHEVVEASFHGPLPPPSILRGYDEIVPGAAERIITMAEKEQAHRHFWEQRALSGERWYSLVGMLAGWTVAIALAVGAVVAAAYDQPAVGIALAAASATGMVWKLVQGRSDNPEQQTEPPKQATKGRETRNRSKRR
jgi:uncharacterized membrane protein